MTKFVRLAALAAAVTIAATPAFAQLAPVSQPATSKAKIMKGLTLTRTGELDFGTIVIDPTAGTETVSVDDTGLRTCGAAVGSKLVCSDASSAIKFTVTGTNNQLVDIDVEPVVLDNGAGGTIPVNIVVPANVTLTSSGAPGVDFYVHGSIDVSAATAEGDYSDTFNVTVQY
jgi:Mat/Ecp fimbriae major subunit